MVQIFHNNKDFFKSAAEDHFFYVYDIFMFKFYQSAKLAEGWDWKTLSLVLGVKLDLFDCVNLPGLLISRSVDDTVCALINDV